jgi:hypothetical protein
MSLNKRRDAFFMDDGEYEDVDGDDYDDGEYVDEEGVAYNDDNEDDKIKYEKPTGRATKSSRDNKSGRASTKGRQLKRWDGKITPTHIVAKPKRGN